MDEELARLHDKIDAVADMTMILLSTYEGRYESLKKNYESRFNEDWRPRSR